MADITSYPLSWPVAQPRLSPARRDRARFFSVYEKRLLDGKFSRKARTEVTIAGALQRLKAEIRMLGATELVVSSNLPVRNDGLPMAKAREPEDPGVAVYCRFRGQVRCFACDRWDRLADNVAAVASHIKAMRAMDRWGVGSLDQLFAGYKALPAMGETRPWWQTLGFKDPPATFDEVKSAAIRQLQKVHPDKTSDAIANQAAEINAAVADARVYYRFE